MKLIIKNMLAIFTVLLLSACSRDSDTSDTLAGVVINEEAIRDDVLLFIETANLTAEQKTQVKRVARYLQEAVLSDPSDIVAVLKTDEKSTVAIGCLSLAFENPADSHQILQTLEYYTANTRARAAAYSAYNEALDGTVTRLPATLDCGE